MRVLDLFSGVGGFSLAFERHGFTTVAFSEVDSVCCKVLRYHWPTVPNLGDVRGIDAADINGLGPIDVITGGFPCIDLSRNGNRSERQGLEGEHSGLWSELTRIVGEVRPHYVVVENVPALLAQGLGDILGDLAACGYDAEWDCIPACAVGAPHVRDRIWLVAYPNRDTLGAESHGATPQPRFFPSRWHNAARLGLAQRRAREAQAVFRGMDDGAADRLDRNHRLKMLGNTVVVEVAALFATFIAEQLQQRKAA